MHFPWWYVPHITAPMLIAGIAVLHVLVSHYAVGGGFFLAVEMGHAYRTRNEKYLEYLRRHAQFFILVTVVFGAITGVGIWWTIGLASPLATATLIQTFVFGWATEWVFFVLELSSAFILYYAWGRLAPKIHVAVAWIYAIAAWISLVLITGITAFMLHPGTWLETKSFWAGFFNPQFFPQVIARTGGAFLLTSLYVLLHASLASDVAILRQMIQRRMARPALLGAALIALGSIWWFLALPESARAAVKGTPVLNVFMALIFALTVAVFFLLYIGVLRNTEWLTPGLAVALCLFGIAAFSIGEFIREAVRKPYIVYNVVLGNQLLVDEVQAARQKGFLESGVWTRVFVRQNYPQVFADGQIDEKKLLTLPEEDQVKIGAVLFMHHCNDCHALSNGYAAVQELLRGQSFETIHHMVTHLEEVKYVMPPWSGTDEEAQLLAKFLQQVAPPPPAGMLPPRE